MTYGEIGIIIWGILALANIVKSEVTTSKWETIIAEVLIVIILIDVYL